ncbi:MAG: hypothetical protein ACO3C1_11130 [Ilumatobacteraceae bacterium]
MSRLATALLHRWQVVVRQRHVVQTAVVACVVTAVVLSLAQPTAYEASVDLLAPPRTSTRVLADSPATITGSALERGTANELAVIEGDVVRTAVQQALRLPSPPERPVASAVRRTDIIRITVRNADPASAAALAQAYADAYIEVRSQQVTLELTTATTELGGIIGRLQDQLAQTPDTSADRATLEGQLETYQLTLEHLNLELLSRTSGVTLVSPAAIPTDPVAPRPWRAGVLALLVGLVIGAGAALILDQRLVAAATARPPRRRSSFDDDISTIDADDVLDMFADHDHVDDDAFAEAHGPDADHLFDLADTVPAAADLEVLADDLSTSAAHHDDTPVHGTPLPAEQVIRVVPTDTAPAPARTAARRPKTRRSR